MLKKLKGHILTLFVFVSILSLGAFVNINSIDDTEVSSFVFSWFIGIIGLCFVIWFRQIGRFDLKMDQMWPFRIPDKWISHKNLVIWYEITTFLAGIFLLFLSVRTIIHLIINK